MGEGGQKGNYIVIFLKKKIRAERDKNFLPLERPFYLFIYLLKCGVWKVKSRVQLAALAMKRCVSI